jgi:hypothetical protein
LYYEHGRSEGLRSNREFSATASEGLARILHTKPRPGDMVVLKAIPRRMLRERAGLANAGQNGNLGRLLSAALLPIRFLEPPG